MTIRKFAVAALLAAGCLAGSPVFAQMQQDTGFYLGGSIGNTQFDIDTGPLVAAGATSVTTDDSDTGWKIYGGYQFHRNWGVEVGYVDLGSVGITGRVGAVPFTGNADVTAWTLALVGTLPINQSFDIFGKVGLYRWKNKASVSAAGIAAAADDNGTDGMVGIGLRYNFTKNFGVQVEAEHFAGDDTATLYSIGLRFKF